MFSLLSSIKSFIAGSADEEIRETEIEDHEPSQSSSNAKLIYTNTTGNKKPPAAPEDEEKFSGEGDITCFDNLMEKGIIDGEYYFNKRNFEDQPLKVRARVHFTAYKSTATGDQWQVRELRVLPSEKEKKIIQMCQRQTLIGRAMENPKTKSLEIHWGHWGITGKEDRDFSLRLPKNHPHLHNLGYQFRQGDYLKIELENESMKKIENGYQVDGHEDELKLLSISANKEKSFIGRITSKIHDRDHFIVDNTVTFTKFDIKSSDYVPVLGDYVICKAIETFPEVNSNFSWRAVDVKKSDLLNYTTGSNRDEDWIDDLDDEDSYLSEALNDKNGITVKPKKIKFCDQKLKSVKMKSVIVENGSRFFHTLVSATITGDQNVAKFTVDSGKIKSNSVLADLQPGKSFTFKISCEPLMLGYTTGILNLDFGDFKILRHVTVTGLCEDSKSLRELRGTNDVVVRKWRNFDEKAALEDMIIDKSRRSVRGPQLVRVPFFVPNRIPTASIPKFLRAILAKEDEHAYRAKFPYLDEQLTFSNYKAKFELSLWLEEIENDKLRRQYDLHDVIMHKHGEFLKFVVPGIQYYKPPILAGDPISAFDTYNKESPKFEGHIQEIRAEDVFVKFHKQFHEKYKQTSVKIQFLLGRMTYKRCHYAIDNADKYLGESWLFPSQIESIKPPRIPFFEDDDETNDLVNQTNNFHLKQPSTSKFKYNYKKDLTKEAELIRSKDRRAPSLYPHKNYIREDTEEFNPVGLKWFNRDLNNEQKNGVRRILMGQARPLPYVIFGPPGTGKTITIVEAIMQVYTLDPTSRILVCTPSNSAADVIAERLVDSGKFSPGDFVRLVGFMRYDANVESSNIPKIILPFCENGDKLDIIARHRIIISTCTTAGQFFQLGLDSDHFSHLFIDEAGNCTEPESIIPCILVALGKGGQVIMAGDPKQLGPVLMNDTPANILGLSLLERLMSFPLYSRNVEEFPEEKYNPMVLTKLVKNYRAHPLLLKIPSRLFYDDELESSADPEETQKLANSLDFLPARGTQLLFHGVKGKEERDEDSPSWYNLQEVYVVCQYVQQLLKAGVNSEDIGIITPYRKQVEKLRKAIPRHLLDFDESMIPKIGSVEEFQGGERNVMIISSVRSVYENKMDKAQDRLEFIYSPKRFNVQITRAKSLLIIVGNPDVLAYNENWKQLLVYIIELKAYTGTNLPIALDNVAKDLYKKASSGAKSAVDDKEDDWNSDNESSDDGLD